MFVIEKGIPLPVGKRPHRLPWESLAQPGDSFFVPNHRLAKSTVWNAGRRLNCCLIYKHEDGGTLVWRKATPK